MSLPKRARGRPMALTITDSSRQGETVSLSLRFPHTAYPVTVVAHQGEIDRVLAVLRQGYTDTH